MDPERRWLSDNNTCALPGRFAPALPACASPEPLLWGSAAERGRAGIFQGAVAVSLMVADEGLNEPAGQQVAAVRPLLADSGLAGGHLTRAAAVRPPAAELHVIVTWAVRCVGDVAACSPAEESSSTRTDSSSSSTKGPWPLRDSLEAFSRQLERTACEQDLAELRLCFSFLVAASFDSLDWVCCSCSAFPC